MHSRTGPRAATALLLSLLLIFGLAPAVSAASPTVTVSPASGEIGTSVIASGSGFPRRTAGSLVLGTTSVALFKTNRIGNFSVSFTVPPVVTTGASVVTATVGASRATTEFVVSPQASTSTTSTTSTTTAPTSEGASLRTAPGHVVATSGPTDPNARYVLVTWDRSDPAATGYQVVRDGVVVKTTTVSGDPWDDLSFTDATVVPSATYLYQVRALFGDGTTSALSPAFRIHVRSTADVGSGRTFEVDTYSGTDRERAQAAVAAATSAGGGVVVFGARTYTFDAPLRVDSADNVVLRGAGSDRTFLQPGFAGESATCGSGGQLVVFTGRQTKLAIQLTSPVAVGERTLKVDSTSGLAAGQRIIFYESPPVNDADPWQMETAGVMQDPGTGRDERHRWDAGQIVAIDTTAKTVTFEQPFSQSFTTAVPWTRLDKGNGNGIERLTVQGRSSTETTHYRLVDLIPQADFTMADVQGRWANRNYVRASGYDIRVVGFKGPLGDPGGTDGSCKYKFSVWRATNFTFVGGEMGEPTHNQNTSFITTQRAQRTLVRASKFWGNRTYAFNEHGLGSRHFIFENNFVAVGPNAEKAGVFVGNSSFGFAGPGIIRNNTFSGNRRDISMQENSYELRILDNIMRNTGDRVISGYGWAGPDTSTDLYGSIRWTIARNRIEGAQGDGIVLGEASSPWYPYPGVKDVIISTNQIGVRGTAIRLLGTSTATKRFQVSNNGGTNTYVRPELVAGDFWHGNADGTSFGTATSTSWSAPYFSWEARDRG